MPLTFLHTAEVHVDTFQRLVAAQDNTIQVKHHVNPSLLEQARKLGADHPDVIQAVEKEVALLVKHGANPVVCTCSTIGDIVESLSSTDTSSSNIVCQRIDRAMADTAVSYPVEEAVEKTLEKTTGETASKITIVAALESTLKPTEALIRSSALRQAKAVEVSLIHIEDAWQHFEAGDNEAYLKTIAQQLQKISADSKAIDVIVLAQASMANAVSYCPNIKIPILSSPALGIKASVQASVQASVEATLNTHKEL